MEVNASLVDKLAHLSRLSFNDDEKRKIGQDLQKMIAFVEKLNALDTTGVSPLLHMGQATNVLREDQVGNMLSQEEALRNAADHDDQFFRVPKVIKK